MKKILYWLQQFDGIWSIPLSFTAFWLVGIILTGIFGYSTGVYDLGFIQPLFLSAAVVIGATNFAVLGIFFTLRAIYRYIYGRKEGSGITINKSKEDFQSLTPIAKVVIALFVLFYYITAIIFVYLKFV